ncbi:MAG: tetratricopeptide repeat protein, partial [Pyrinomonadaceae bacterium]
LVTKIEMRLFLCLLLSGISAYGQNPPPQTNLAGPTLTAAQWQTDLQFLAANMQRQHPNLFRRVPKTEFDAAVKSLNDRIPSAGVEEILTGFMRIVAMVKDGHTGMFPAEYFRSGVFPVRFYLFEDGLFIQKAAPQYAELAGAKVIKIGDLAAGEAFNRVATLAGADNEMGVRENAPLFLAIPEILTGIGILDPKQDLKLTVEIGGKQRTVDIKREVSVNELIRTPTDWLDAAAKKPLYLQHTEDLYWFEYLKDKKLIYVQQNAVANKSDETIAAFYERVMKFADAHPVDKFVIDLRRNDGGNNGLNRPVVIGLIKSKINERGKLFVITGRRTFSAAQNFVNELEKYTNSIFVGEPTAGRPNHYGDGRGVTLPNSRLNVQISTLYWQDMDPRDNRQWTAPQVAASLSSTDYSKAVDPALQAIINYKPQRSLREIAMEMFQANDLKSFRAKALEFKNNPVNVYQSIEADINTFGYRLVSLKKMDEAVDMFKLNTELYPNSANAFDSLGEAYATQGNKEEAIRSYEKALSIDPAFASSVEALMKLKGN